MSTHPSNGPRTAPTPQDFEVPVSELRWLCDPAELGFKTTREVEPLQGVVGQDDAIEALRFGLELRAPGQHVFVRGLAGTGRSTLVRHLLEELQPSCPSTGDFCYVHDFSGEGRPRLVEIARGKGAAFRDRTDELARFIAEELAPELSSEEIQRRKKAIDKRLQERLQELGSGFEDELRADELALVMVQMGQVTRPAVVPMVDGRPSSPEEIEQLIAEGKMSEEDASAVRERVAASSERVEDLARRMAEVQKEHGAEVRSLFAQEMRRILGHAVAEIEEEFPSEQVKAFLSDVVDDVVATRLRGEATEESVRRYRVNLVLEHEAGAPCPVIVETAPTLSNLVGAINSQIYPGGVITSDHMMITAGSMLRAHGGYLIIEAREVLQEPGAWKVLVRTLRTGKLEIATQESLWFGAYTRLHPEPVEVDLKVVLLGDPGLHALLDAYDLDFPELFKVLADFDSTIPRNREGLLFYAGIVSRLARDENMLPFGRCAVSGLAEHGARIAARRDRMTSRFGRLADIAREANYLARRASAETVLVEHVREAVQRIKRRADLPSRKFRELIREKTVRIQTDGVEVGQINGLAVTRSGQLTYGFPARITATIGAGSAGAINIEREAMLSGAIHTKGFYILGGLLRRLLRTDHPLAFSASIAFEQSYGGIDGDSASGAEICCLLSALTEVPLRQDIAMTGAIDQFGHLQVVGATTEKIEGFFDVCQDSGADGNAGVIVPKGNVGDLMLRADVVEACAEGLFHIYAVDTIHEALAILTGLEVGRLDESGEYPEGTLLRTAVERAGKYWKLASPPRPSASKANSPGDDDAD